MGGDIDAGFAIRAPLSADGHGTGQEQTRHQPAHLAAGGIQYATTYRRPLASMSRPSSQLHLWAGGASATTVVCPLVRSTATCDLTILQVDSNDAGLAQKGHQPVHAVAHADIGFTLPSPC